MHTFLLVHLSSSHWRIKLKCLLRLISRPSSLVVPFSSTAPWASIARQRSRSASSCSGSGSLSPRPLRLSNQSVTSSTRTRCTVGSSPIAGQRCRDRNLPTLLALSSLRANHIVGGCCAVSATKNRTFLVPAFYLRQPQDFNLCEQRNCRRAPGGKTTQGISPPGAPRHVTVECVILRDTATVSGWPPAPPTLLYVFTQHSGAARKPKLGPTPDRHSNNPDRARPRHTDVRPYPTRHRAPDR